MNGRGASIVLWIAVAAILAFILAPILVTIAVAFTTAPYLSFPPVGFTWEWGLHFYLRHILALTELATETLR